jgi:NDP-sugar pyrophosphorylase family protein
MRGKADHSWDSQAEAPSKAVRLRAMLTSPELEFLKEARNGLSAKIVEEAGFKGIWVSSLPKSSMLDLLQRLIDKGTSIRAVYVPEQWFDVDDAADFTRAGKFL